MNPGPELDKLVHDIICRDRPSRIGIPVQDVPDEPVAPPYSTKWYAATEVIEWILEKGLAVTLCGKSKAVVLDGTWYRVGRHGISYSLCLAVLIWSYTEDDVT